jgi:hypothetical protein
MMGGQGDRLAPAGHGGHIRAAPYTRPALADIPASLADALALLHRACDERDGVLMYARTYPAFRSLQTDPRMTEIYRRIGFPGS